MPISQLLPFMAIIPSLSMRSACLLNNQKGERKEFDRSKSGREPQDFVYFNIALRVISRVSGFNTTMHIYFYTPDQN